MGPNQIFKLEIDAVQDYMVQSDGIRRITILGLLSEA